MACDDPVVREEFERLGRLVAAADPVFHRTLVRQRHLLQDKPEAEISQAIELVRVLIPGCAAGRPLRALGVCGVDSKFFERHCAPIVQLLDARFDGRESDPAGRRKALRQISAELVSPSLRVRPGQSPNP